MTSIPIDELVSYFLGELEAGREAAVEESLFEDEETARRLDAIARLGDGVRDLVRGGRLKSALSARSVEAMERAGLRLRTYGMAPGQTVPCSIQQEDLVVLRLTGAFGDAERVDIAVDARLEGAPPASEQMHGVPVDREAREVVLVFPGDTIRALPRSHFTYRVTAEDGRSVGEYRLDHTP